MSAAALPRLGPDWLAAYRARGAARFSETGLPTQRDEVWKYTGLNSLKKLGFEPASHDAQDFAPAETAGASPTVPASLFEGEADRIIFVDGRFAPGLSRVGSLPTGVLLGSLATLLAEQPSVVEPLLGRLADPARRPMVALNAAWIADGLVLIVPDRVVLERPIELVSVISSGRAAYPRHVIALGEGAQAVLVEREIGGDGFADGVIEVALGAGAGLDHHVLRDAGPSVRAVTTVQGALDRDARYRSFVLTLGGGLVRHEVELRLAGAGASCQLGGADLLDDGRHADTTILIDHAAPHCTSRQSHYSVLDDRARSVFQGKVLVRPGAQKTDAYQISRALLLSPEAETDLKPELEIYADDVKCSHGATSGRLDPEAMFYLRARGIPEPRARALLIEGFIGGALDEIEQAAIRDAFKEAAASRLAERARIEGST